MRKLILAFALLATPAFAQPSTPMSMAASPADKSFSTGMDKMNADMAGAPMTGNADQDFVAMMLPHHEGAVAMAKTELQYGKDPHMRELAKNIIAAQDKEIAEMHAWQAKHPAQK
jgi:uncharacterized protein (DUF305 family)